jgi:hypothetical protein
MLCLTGKEFSYQSNHLTRFGMPSGLKLGVEQRSVHFHFKPAAIGWHQVDVFDLGLEGL